MGTGDEEQATMIMRRWINNCSTKKDKYRCELEGDDPNEIIWESSGGSNKYIDLLTFFERGFYMDTDTFTQPRRICDRTGAHLKGCRMVKAPKGRRRALVVSRKMFETVNEVMEERDEGSLRVCYEDEEKTHNISTHAHIEDTEVSIDASREWNEHDKGVIEGWKSIEVVTEHIVKGQEDGEDWCREIEKFSKKRFGRRPESKDYGERNLTAAEIAEIVATCQQRRQLSEAAVTLIIAAIVEAASQSRDPLNLIRTLRALKRVTCDGHSGNEHDGQMIRLWKVMEDHIVRKTNEQDKTACELGDFLQCMSLVRDWKGGCAMRVKGKIVDVADTQVMTTGSVEDCRGEQIYRSRDIEERHIKDFKEKINEEKLRIKKL